MPIHDWEKVFPGAFQDFHHSWIVEVARVLNRDLLPSDHYALIERREQAASRDQVGGLLRRLPGPKRGGRRTGPGAKLLGFLSRDLAIARGGSPAPAPPL
jgi:hypothetical protein